jgi:hypothetical protein
MLPIPLSVVAFLFGTKGTRHFCNKHTGMIAPCKYVILSELQIFNWRTGAAEKGSWPVI